MRVNKFVTVYAYSMVVILLSRKSIIKIVKKLLFVLMCVFINLLLKFYFYIWKFVHKNRKLRTYIYVSVS